MSMMIEEHMPAGLPPPLQVGNWPEFEPRDAIKVWQHYEQFLFEHGYHIMGSHLYNTLGEGVTEIPPPPADPFHPKDNETFIYHHKPLTPELQSTRTPSLYQPGVAICFGIDSFQRQVVVKALMYDSRELEILRTLTSPPLYKDKLNHTIPVLKFLKTRDFVIVVMACWGEYWFSPPCGSMSTRCEMAIKITKGLVWYHEQRIAHGDIHPGNIVVSHDSARERPTLPGNDYRKNSDLQYAFIDFEAAHIIPHGQPPLASLESTPPEAFCSPEQLNEYPKEGVIDVFAADVYNLGKTLESELSAAPMRYGEDYLPAQTHQQYEQYKSLLSTMTDPRPDNRPTMADVLSTLKLIFVNGENDRPCV